MTNVTNALEHPNPEAVVNNVDERVKKALTALELVNRKKASRKVISAKTLGRLNT